jgi:uncharacterized protein YyaL (SSP411 family)
MASPNRLTAETSPYLLQHANNPVHWQPWDEQALTQARQENRPILLSIGYSACHWCHVMAHESFEDDTVAAVMNRLFVNIKVDREERPDLDQIYQTAHHLLTRRNGGWPLTMFLAPDGTPFFAGTYFPKEPRYGLPGFADLSANAWRRPTASAATDIAAQAGELRAGNDGRRTRGADRPRRTGPSAARLQPKRMLARGFDSKHGGFGGAPKFPHPTDLAFLLGRDSDAAAREMALTTLRRMCEGGIYDQIGGGFARYSVDERWEIPHFEKMLYDNGPLLALCADAWAMSGEPDFARVVEETVAWVCREMQAPEGGYFSALDADSEGEEGKYYVWDREDIASLLTPQESALAARRWGFDGPPNFEGRHWHARVATAVAPDEEALLASARRKLFAARERRVRPGCDDKILTSWNALMIEGMAHAARVFARDDWLRSAQGAANFLRTTMWHDDRLLATARGGRAHLDAYLDDYAFLLAALLEMMQAEFRIDDLDFAIALADSLLARFEDKEAGGFHFTAHDHETLIHRPKSGHDNATPSGNGVAAFALQRLGHLLGETRYLEAADRTLQLFWPHIRQAPGGFASLLRAAGEAMVPPEIVILRGPSGALADWVGRLGANPRRMVLALPNGTSGLPPMLAKPESDAVNAWVCRGVTCSAPTANIEDLLN